MGWTVDACRVSGVMVVVCAAAYGCVDDQPRRLADTADATPTGPPCSGQADCDKFANACNTSACIERVCRTQPVVCDDQSACTEDRCDAALGCVFDRKEAGSPCLVDRSETCAGPLWHLPDRCDTAGQCIDGGVQACSVIGAPVQCQEYACVEGSGCVLAELSDGSACVQGGKSDTCVAGVRYGADECVDGECIDGGSEACPVGFCAQPDCDGSSCSGKPIGVDVDITGPWTMFQLADDDTGQPRAARLEVELTAQGTMTMNSMLAPDGELRPARGEYCVSTDSTLQLALVFDDGGRRTLVGNVSRGRDLAFLSEQGRDGISVLVKQRPVAEAKKLSGNYRIVGLDDVVVPGTTRLDAILGWMTLDGQWCVTGGGYLLGLLDLDVSIRGDLSGCVEFGEANEIAVDVDAPGDPRRWSGVVGVEGHFAVLQRRGGSDNLPAPSLIFLVREGLGHEAWYDGDYATTRFDAASGTSRIVVGEQTVDGAGRVIALAEPGWTLGPDDDGFYFVSGEAPLSGVRETITIGGVIRRRVGQLGPMTSNRTDWFVDVAVDHENTSYSGPPRGASLRLGVRVP